MVQHRKNTQVSSLRRKDDSTPSRRQDKTSRFQLILTTCLSVFLSTSIFCAPEGAIREGDYLPIALLFFVVCLCVALTFYSFFPLLPIGKKEKRQESVETSQCLTEKIKRWVPILADVALAACLLLYTASSLKVVLLHTGDVRLALNGYWSFVTPALFYFFLRYYRRFLAKGIIFELFLAVSACVVAECVFSAYSYAVVNPKIRAAYIANPNEVLAENGMKFEEDSRERLLFEQRLLNSVEPTGTYGLANTLAGVVVPLLLLSLVGIPWYKLFLGQRGLKDVKRVLGGMGLSGALFVLLLEFFVLFTTKSRSAFVALMIGLIFWGLCRLKDLKLASAYLKRGAQFFVAACAVCFLSGVIAILSGAIDREVFTEAGKSLSYRLEYWKATIGMIKDNPFLGVGPGEFQSVYPRYILPTSSEFIADPHNFAFEVGALFGTPALLAFVLFLIATFASAWAAGANICLSKTSEKRVGTPAPSLNGRRHLRLASFVGLLIGLASTFLCSCFQTVPVNLSFYSFAFTSFCFFYAIVRAIPSDENRSVLDAPILALAAALVTLLINLCAAGGIGYAPISTILFLIAASLVNRASSARDVLQADLDKDCAQNEFKESSGVKKCKPIWSISLSLTVLTIFYFTSYKPRTDVFLFELRSNANTNALTQPSHKVDLKKLDPASSTTATQRYYIAGLKYSQKQDDANLREWQTALEEVERVSPNSPSIRERCGDFDFLLYKGNKERSEFLDSAIILYRESVDRSPTDVSKMEKLFMALRLANRLNEASDVARDALRIDKTTPHEDRKLTDNMRKEMLGFVGASE